MVGRGLYSGNKVEREFTEGVALARLEGPEAEGAVRAASSSIKQHVREVAEKLVAEEQAPTKRQRAWRNSRALAENTTLKRLARKKNEIRKAKRIFRRMRLQRAPKFEPYRPVVVVPPPSPCSDTKCADEQLKAEQLKSMPSTTNTIKAKGTGL
jgi:hypothetical protein